MNLEVTLIVDFPTIGKAQQIRRLLPSSGRPLFLEDVAPEDQATFEAIQYIHCPDEIKLKKKRLLLSWHETEHSFITLKNAVEKVGGEVVFAHILEDSDPVEWGDIDGLYFYRVNDELQRVNKQTYKQVFPDYEIPWNSDNDANTRQVCVYLMDKA